MADCNVKSRGAAHRDRLSLLPEYLVHHIMSLLSSTEDATKVGTLSKYFLSIWRSFPIIDLDVSRLISGHDTDSSLNFVHNFISTRELKTNLNKFRLVVAPKSCGDTNPSHRIDEAIKFAIQHSVQVLDVEIVGSGSYKLPWNILCSAKSITILKLNGINFGLNSEDVGGFGNLLLLGCPLIETLIVSECAGFVDFKIGDDVVGSSSKLKLRTCELSNCHGLQLVDINASSLEYFVFVDRRCFMSPCKINIAACKNLKSFSLSEGKGTILPWLQDHISKLPRLEYLELAQCRRLRRVNISHQKLKTLCLYECYDLLDVRCNTPELASFKYRGIDAFTFTSMYAGGNLVVSISLSLLPKDCTDGKFVLLRNMLAHLGYCKFLTLACTSAKCLIFPEDLRGELLPPLGDVPQMKVKIDNKLEASYMDLVDSLLWLAPSLETLYIVLEEEQKEKSIRFQYETIEEASAREERPVCSCCVGRYIKCWRHSLKTVELVDFEDGDDPVRLFKYLTQNATYGCYTQLHPQ